MSTNMKRTYLDHASATPVCKEATKAVASAATLFGNPGATHAEALAAKELLQGSRERIAAQLSCKARELVFTSGLTESNNLAILGLARKFLIDHQGDALMGTHWIVSSMEHDAVLECFAEVERLGGKVTHVDPDERGIISAQKIKQALQKETVLVSIGWANNETGTLQPLRDISQAMRAHERAHGTRVLLHTDAGQAPLYLHPSVHSLGVDMLALGSGKLYGPRGIGALYISNRAQIAPIQLGGGQERGLRAGTEDAALAAGFAAAFDVIAKERSKEAVRLRALRDVLAKALAEEFPGAILNTNLSRSAPHILNMSFPGIQAEYAVLVFDRKGIAISTKSACNEGNTASHVVVSLGGPSWRAKNTLRFSLGRSTKASDISHVVKISKSAIRSA